MALGERSRAWPDTEHLMFVKVGTGIGAGLISHGRPLRGAQGAAGDIGHIHVRDHDDVLCRCGNRGCLEAVAGGGALAIALTAEGLPAADVRDVVRLFREGHPEVTSMIRAAGRQLGEVLAASVNAFNPAVIVIGGELAEADDPLLAGVREIVYQRAVPLGTRSLRIVPVDARRPRRCDRRRDHGDRARAGARLRRSHARGGTLTARTLAQRAAG